MVELIEKNLVYKIVGCALAVHNEIGHGMREKTYERGLCVEFEHENLRFSQQKSYSAYYREVKLDDYIPDLEVEGRVSVDAKTVDKIADEHRGQVLNYLRVSGLPVGLIINFKHPKLEWERIVLDSARGS